MTARQVFEYALVELNKVQAPSLLLEDYNYFINKAVNQYINKIYNAYEVNQQKSDDLRVLKGTTVLTPTPQNDYTPNGISSPTIASTSLFGATYEVQLPDDYLHILNCIAEYNVNKTFKCYNAGDTMYFGVKKLTSDMFSQIINNYYMRPSYKNPYFFINNVNTNNTFPVSTLQETIVEPRTSQTITGTPSNLGYLVIGNSGNTITITFKTTPTDVLHCGLSLELLYTKLQELAQVKSALSGFIFTYNSTTGLKVYKPSTAILDATFSGLTSTAAVIYYTDLVEKTPELRYGNKSKVRMEIRYGKDASLFELKKVYVDYLKAPQFIRLTQTQVDEVEDNTQIIEFPDYVCQEIVNELIKLLMENASDPRLQTNIPVSQSIAQPQQEQPQKR